MRRWKVIIGILTLVLSGILAVVFWPEKEMPEPMYGGKKLGEWVLAANTPTGSSEAVLAIKTIGTNGIPCYLEWIRYKQGVGKRAQLRFAGYGSRWFGSKWVAVDTKLNRSMGAIQALRILGERADPAIPQYVAFITNNPTLSRQGPSLDDAMSGYLLLAQVGQPVVPAFLSLMTNQDPRIRASAIHMSMMNYDTSLVAQVQLSLQDTDARVRSAATNVMRTYDPDFGLPIHKP